MDVLGYSLPEWRGFFGQEPSEVTVAGPEQLTPEVKYRLLLQISDKLSGTLDLRITSYNVCYTKLLRVQPRSRTTWFPRPA